MAVSRRSFIKLISLTLASLPLLDRLSFAEGELPLLKDGEEPGKSLKFCSNADKPTKLCVQRKSKDKAKQYCYNCQLFTKTEGEKKASKGKCMIMPKNRVDGGAWCMSWVQNPAVND